MPGTDGAGVVPVSSRCHAPCTGRGSAGASRSHASRGQIRTQFLAESLLLSLSLVGGLGGAALSSAVTAVYAIYQNWPVGIPLWAVAGGAFATLVIGGLPRAVPAIRASRLAPTEALATQ